MASKPLPSPETLRQLLEFYPFSGVLTWKVRDSHMIKDPRIRSAWNARNSGKKAMTCLSPNGYHTGSVLGHPYLAHRVAWAIHYGEWPNSEIDHINGVRTDNRISNLREVSREINSKNTKVRSGSQSPYPGVSKHRNKWMARIKIRYVSRYLGLFDDVEDAIKARKSAEFGNGFHENHGRKE